MRIALILLFLFQDNPSGIPMGIPAHTNYDYPVYVGDVKTSAKGEYRLEYKDLYGGPMPVAPSCTVEDKTKAGPVYFKDERSLDHVIFVAPKGHTLHYICKARFPKKGTH